MLAAVDWAAEDLKARTGIPVRLQLPEQEVTIEQDLATAVFRMFQDMLSNIADHSGVTEVTVHLWCDGGNLLIEVRDNGDGLDQERLPTGNSLAIIEMRERARQAGGEFFISTEPGKGTLAGVRIPVIGSQ